MTIACDESLIASLAELCLSRDAGARNIDAFLDQRILPTVSRELLARMATGAAPAEIRLAHTEEGNLSIEFVDRGEPAPTNI